MSNSDHAVHDDKPGCWHIVGAGCIGSLAAAYLQRAGAEITVVRPGPAHVSRQILAFDRDDAPVRQNLELNVKPPVDCGPVSQLIVASKTPYTHAAMDRVNLTHDATVIRLQNGLGSVDGRLKPGQRLIEGVTRSAVMSEARDTLHVVAENATALGGGPCPTWFNRLAAHWPALTWADDIRPTQWRKLIANAVINPLTAIHDVPNGALLERIDLQADMTALIDETDALLVHLDRRWLGNSHAAVADVVRATAANTSSMRADIGGGTITEIEAINGWLLRRAAEHNIDLPTHRRIVAQVRALEPRSITPTGCLCRKNHSRQMERSRS